MIHKHSSGAGLEGWDESSRRLCGDRLSSSSLFARRSSKSRWLLLVKRADNPSQPESCSEKEVHLDVAVYLESGQGG